MKDYIPWIILALFAIFSLLYSQRFMKKIGTPSIIQELSINSKNLEREVKLWIYLPPDYLEASEPLPVLYMHDGQNLFDEELSFAGEWHVDKSLDTLYQQKQFQLVVVGIENGGVKRLEELTPFQNKKHGGGKAKAYLDFMEEELFPYIQSKYNVSHKREDTGMMGSSLGGLMTFYAAFDRTDVYTKFGVYSPSFWFSKEVFQLPKNKKLPSDVRMVMMIGKKEERQHHEVIKMKKILDSTQDFFLETKIIPQGRHNEKFWAKHFKDDIYKLYHPTP